MATLTGNPVVLGTADTGTTAIVSNGFKVSAIVWDPGTGAANADICLIKDRLGVAKWSTTLITGNLVPASINFPVPVLFDGLILTTLTRGTVYIYLKNSNNLVA